MLNLVSFYLKFIQLSLLNLSRDKKILLRWKMNLKDESLWAILCGFLLLLVAFFKNTIETLICPHFIAILLEYIFCISILGIKSRGLSVNGFFYVIHSRANHCSFGFCLHHFFDSFDIYSDRNLKLMSFYLSTTH